MGIIDLDYLENNNYDNLNMLKDFNKTYNDNKQNKIKLEKYINKMNKKNKTNILEFNISKYNSKEK